MENFSPQLDTAYLWLSQAKQFRANWTNLPEYMQVFMQEFRKVQHITTAATTCTLIHQYQ